jgi:hypothetical protein
MKKRGIKKKVLITELNYHTMLELSTTREN